MPTSVIACRHSVIKVAKVVSRHTTVMASPSSFRVSRDSDLLPAVQKAQDRRGSERFRACGHPYRGPARGRLALQPLRLQRLGMVRTDTCVDDGSLCLDRGFAPGLRSDDCSGWARGKPNRNKSTYVTRRRLFSGRICIVLTHHPDLASLMDAEIRPDSGRVVRYASTR